MMSHQGETAGIRTPTRLVKSQRCCRNTSVPIKKPDVALTPGLAGEPAMHPMSQAERIQTQRIRLVAGNFAATEPISLRIVSCRLHVLLTVKTQMIVSSGVGHSLADSELDARCRERFASVWIRCAWARIYFIGLEKRPPLSKARSLGGVVYQPRGQPTSRTPHRGSSNGSRWYTDSRDNRGVVL